MATPGSPHPNGPWGRLACRVTGLEQATHDVRIVRLEPDDGRRLAFKPGQYAAVRFGELPARDYSMASPPGARHLEFHIRAMSDSGASAYVAERLALGDTAILEGPLGEAYLRAEHRGPILAIAGGTGLAPMQAIVESALAGDPRRRIALYFGVRAARDLYRLEAFRALAARHAGFRFEPLVSDPASGHRPPSHRVGLPAGAALADLPELAGFKAYLAGPPAMVGDAVAALLAAGLPEADIHADPFINEHEKAGA